MEQNALKRYSWTLCTYKLGKSMVSRIQATCLTVHSLFKEAWKILKMII
jgi:hypothetical protein